MMGISLHQPWASLIAIGAKKIGTRDWRTNYRGPLAIQAALRWTAEQREAAAEFRDYFNLALPDPMPRGEIIAACQLVDCIRVTEEWIEQQTPMELELGGWEVGRYGWVFAAVIPVTGVPLKGKQGLWKLRESDVERVKAGALT